MDATEQLQRVGTRLLGAVVLPRLAAQRAGNLSAPAVTLPSPGVEPVIEEATLQITPPADRGEPVSAAVRPRPSDEDSEPAVDMSGPGATDGDEK